VPLDDAMYRRICRHLLNDLALLQVELEEGGNHTRAAQRIGLTPQRVGQIRGDLLRDLPDYFEGLPLVDEGQAPEFARTDAGQRVLEFAIKVREMSDSLVTELRRLKQGRDLDVATVNSAWYAFGPQWRQRLAQRVPNAVVREHLFPQPNWQLDIYNAVRTFKTDVGITSYPWKTPAGLRQKELTSYPFVLVLPANHPYQPKDGRTAEMTGSHFAKDRFVLYAPIDGYMQTSPVFKYLTKKCGIMDDRGGEVPRRRFICRSAFADCKKAVVDGEGLSILPLPVVASRLPDAAQFKTFELNPAMDDQWNWSLVHRVAQLRPIVRTFVDTVLELDAEHRQSFRESP
jgi:DNA-binding transcriptional LysR family regulator